MQVDSETQKEIEEFERRLDAENAQLRMAHKYGAQVIPATTDNTNVVPVGGREPLDADSVSTAYTPGIRSDDNAESEDIGGLLDNLPRHTEPLAVNEHGQLEKSHAAPDAPEARLNRDSSPEEVCIAFLNALAKGDHIGASQMLTNIAQIETARADLQLESPGGEGAAFEVLAAEFATAEKKVAQVKCRLHQPGQSNSAMLTWLMRSQYNGWKISGMTIQMSEDGPIDLLSFENPNDLQRIQHSVDESEVSAHSATSLSGSGEN